METFLNFISDSFGCSEHLPAILVFKNLISSGVQLHISFSRAVRNLTSSGVWSILQLPTDPHGVSLKYQDRMRTPQGLDQDWKWWTGCGVASQVDNFPVHL